MNVEEIAKKICEHNYLKLCDTNPGMNTTYSFKKYWETNKEYFIHRAKIYLEVKNCLEAK